MRSDGGSSGESRGSDNTPVAPPRIKRTSGAPRHSALDPNPPLQDRRMLCCGACSGLRNDEVVGKLEATYSTRLCVKIDL